MALLGIDLGGTKAAFAIFSEDGKMLSRKRLLIDGRKGNEITALITGEIEDCKQKVESNGASIRSIGVSVPGIVYRDKGTVWAPNIPGWENYPLLEKITSQNPQIPAIIDNDRACYIQGEAWQGNARGCTDAIYLSVGTGIGAGILTNGKILRGANDIAGAIGWMALLPPFDEAYKQSGCFEHFASGSGIAKQADKLLMENMMYNGPLREKAGSLTAIDVFDAFDKKDVIAIQVIDLCICFWGMAVANLVSLFNPQKIILGGGVFGPAIKLLPAIKEEAAKWAQPVGEAGYVLENSALGNDAGVYGAAFQALQLKYS